MSKIIIFDLDGTLANCEHRKHLIESKPPDWDAFYLACGGDTVNEAVACVYYSMQCDYDMGYRIEVWSGRGEIARKLTEKWLRKHSFDGIWELRMRPIGDTTPDEVLKKRWLDEVGKENVLMVFDDRSKVVKMWRENGVPCFQVAEGDF